MSLVIVHSSHQIALEYVLCLPLAKSDHGFSCFKLSVIEQLYSYFDFSACSFHLHIEPFFFLEKQNSCIQILELVPTLAEFNLENRFLITHTKIYRSNHLQLRKVELMQLLRITIGCYYIGMIDIFSFLLWNFIWYYSGTVLFLL